MSAATSEIFWSGCLEPISKSPEEDNEAGELNKAEEVLGVVLPADEDSALPLDPGDRYRRRDHRPNSPAWLRSCRSRSTVAPGGLRDGWPHACLPIAAIHGDQQSP